MENQSKDTQTTSIENIQITNKMNSNQFNHSQSDGFGRVNITPQSSINLPAKDLSNSTFPINDSTYGNDSNSFIYNTVFDSTTNCETVNDGGPSKSYQNIYTDSRNIHVNNQIHAPQPPEGRPILNTSLIKLAAYNQSGKSTRSPLTAMVNNIVMKNSPAINFDSLPLKNGDYQSSNNVAATNCNDFFLYQEKSTNETEEDYFSKLSDEIILAIFKYLPKKALNLCSYVCRRFSNVVQDETLWTRMDLASKHIQPGAMGHILNRGVIILRMAQTKVNIIIFISYNFV